MTEKNERYSLSTLMAFVLVAVLPMAVATGFSNFERSRDIVLAILASLALIGWAVGALRSTKGVSLFSPGTLLLGGIFLFYVLLSLFWTPVFLLGQLSVITWVSLGILFLILVAPPGRKPEFLDFATATATGAIAAGVFGLYEFFGGTALIPVWRPSGIAGGFDSIVFASSYYLLALPIVIAGLATSPKGIRRWFMAISLGLGGAHFAMVVSPLLLALLGAAMVLAALPFIMAKKFGKTGPSAQALITSLVVLLVGALGMVVVERPTKETDANDLPRISPSVEFHDEQASDDILRWPYFAADRMESPLDQRFRPYLNSTIRGLVEQEPLLGHGPAGWRMNHLDIAHDGDEAVRKLFYHHPRFSSPHSDYGRVLVEQGILGFLFFLLFLAGICTALAGGIRSKEGEEKTSLALWAVSTTFLAGLAMMYFIPVLELKSSAAVFVAAAAMGIALSSQTNKKSQWLKERRLFKGAMVFPLLALLVATGVSIGLTAPTVIHAKSALARGQADHLMVRSFFAEALDHYLDAHAIYPAYGEVAFNISLAYGLTGKRARGYEAALEAVELAPHDSRILTHAATLALHTGRIDRAMEFGHHAVRTGPNHIAAYDAYAAALQRRARYDDSAVVLQRGLERGLPLEFSAIFNLRLGMLYADQFSEPEKAIEYLEMAQKQMPHGPEREFIGFRLNELEKRIERELLEEEGLPIPPHLLPAEPHNHNHGPGGHHHGPGHNHPGGHDHGAPVMPGLPSEGEDHYHR